MLAGCLSRGMVQLDLEFYGNPFSAPVPRTFWVTASCLNAPFVVRPSFSFVGLHAPKQCVGDYMMDPARHTKNDF